MRTVVRAVVLVVATSAVAYAGEVHPEEADDLPPEQTSTGTVAGPQPPPYKPFNLFSLLGKDALVAEIERRHLKAETYPELLELVSRGLVAAPYLLSPLGEGTLPDPDPRFRMDAFDCTTFVETAIAMARCDDLREVERVLDDVRYAGEPGFEHRRHLMTSQWIPGLIDAGYVEDITEQVGGDRTKWIDLKMTKRRWERRRVARSLKLEADRVPTGRFRLPYLTVADLKKLLKKIPPGTIINVVRENRLAYPDVITHQGLVIHKPGVGEIPIVRHASPVSKRVIDETLAHMLMRYTRPRKWPIIGMNILRVVDPREQTTPTLAAEGTQ